MFNFFFKVCRINKKKLHQSEYAKNKILFLILQFLPIISFNKTVKGQHPPSSCIQFWNYIFCLSAKHSHQHMCIFNAHRTSLRTTQYPDNQGSFLTVSSCAARCCERNQINLVSLPTLPVIPLSLFPYSYWMRGREVG